MTKLNPFVKGKKPEHIDEVVVGDNELDELFGKYKVNYLADADDIYRIFKDVPALEPTRISILMNKVMDFDYDHEGVILGGLFGNILIQKAFDNGYNDFYLDTKDFRVDFLGYKLKGNNEKSLKLSIDGNAWNNFGKEAEFCDFKVDGTCMGYVGYDARNCSFKLNIATNMVGLYAEDCSFTIDNVSHYFNFGHRAVNCKFCSSNDDVLKALMASRTQFGKGCEVIRL